jgi:hypothetical protein
LNRISDDDLASIRDYASDSFMTAPPPFKTVSGELLLMMADELIERRKAPAMRGFSDEDIAELKRV